MGQPAARLGDMHTCPKVEPGPVPHVGGPILPACCPTVLIGNMPAARVGDKALCNGPVDTISQGSATVLIGNQKAARLGDPTEHGGVIVAGFPTVLIGDAGGSGSGSATTGGAVAPPVPKEAPAGWFKSIGKRFKAGVTALASAAAEAVETVIETASGAFETAVWTGRYDSLNAEQFKVCRHPNGTRSVEHVRRSDDGTYQSIGSVPDPAGLESIDQIVPHDPKPIPLPFPEISHLNGIMTTPASAVSATSGLADQLIKTCPAYRGRSACVLTTYSATRGFATDMIEALTGKGGLDTAVTEVQTQQMLDAAKSGRHITISAHSRGTIHTVNGRINARQRLTRRLLRENREKYAEAAAKMVPRTGGRTPAGLARSIAAERLASRDAATLLANDVTSLYSGNAIYLPDPDDRGTLLVAKGDLFKGNVGNDLVTSFTGRGDMVADGSKIGDLTVKHITDPEVLAKDRLLKHGFPEIYSRDVARAHCAAMTSRK